MAEHVNFYENIAEANMRLRNTVVMYDGEPHYVFAITGHNKDGIFRVYMLSLTDTASKNAMPPEVGNYVQGQNELGTFLDKAMAAYPKIVRKQMNSPMFSKFRPFPLGMCNYKAEAYYLERQPVRPKTEQGLTRNMITQVWVEAGPDRQPPTPCNVDLFTAAFRDCVLGAHPSAKECLRNLLDREVQNRTVAFHRNFALVRGPVGMMFLAYKEDAIGVLPNLDFSRLNLGRTFKHCREVVEELRLFGSIHQN